MLTHEESIRWKFMVGFCSRKLIALIDEYCTAEQKTEKLRLSILDWCAKSHAAYDGKLSTTEMEQMMVDDEGR